MAECKREDIKGEMTLRAMKWLDEHGVEYKVYNGGAQINIKDDNGITQTCYPNTGTLYFKVTDDKYDPKHASLRNRTLKEFMYYLHNPDAIEELVIDGIESYGKKNN